MCEPGKCFNIVKNEIKIDKERKMDPGTDFPELVYWFHHLIIWGKLSKFSVSVYSSVKWGQ